MREVFFYMFTKTIHYKYTIILFNKMLKKLNKNFKVKKKHFF